MHHLMHDQIRVLRMFRHPCRGEGTKRIYAQTGRSGIIERGLGQFSADAVFLQSMWDFRVNQRQFSGPWPVVQECDRIADANLKPVRGLAMNDFGIRHKSSVC